MIKLIGLIGKAGSGKDTAAQVLIEKHDFAHCKFAKPLKDIVSRAFGIEDRYLEDPLFKDEKFPEPWLIEEDDFERFTDNLPYNFVSSANYDVIKKLMIGTSIDSVRKLLQFIGTDVVRNHIDPQFWTSMAKSKIEYWKSHHSSVVFTDVRFNNEVDLIKKEGGIIVRVDKQMEIVDNHVSEQLRVKPDYVLRNEGTIEELHKKMEELL